jgi:hypothetical protein
MHKNVLIPNGYYDKRITESFSSKTRKQKEKVRCIIFLNEYIQDQNGQQSGYGKYGFHC